MKFKDRAETCHISGYIYRKGNPEMKYARNHQISLEDRVPKSEQLYDDWEEFDPDEEYGHY